MCGEHRAVVDAFEAVSSRIAWFQFITQMSTQALNYNVRTLDGLTVADLALALGNQRLVRGCHERVSVAFRRRCAAVV